MIHFKLCMGHIYDIQKININNIVSRSNIINLYKIMRFLHKYLVKLRHDIDEIDYGVDWVLISIQYKCRFSTWNSFISVIKVVINWYYLVSDKYTMSQYYIHLLWHWQDPIEQSLPHYLSIMSKKIINRTLVSRHSPSMMTRYTKFMLWWPYCINSQIRKA